MAEFLSAFLVVLFLVTLFSIIGVGFFALALPADAGLSREDPYQGESSLRSTCLLSPLIGYILVTAVGLVNVNVLLVPLQPVANLSVLIVLSAGACWLKRRALRHSLHVFMKQRGALFLIAPALIAALNFSFAFQNSGLELLSGSEDELQYCSNAAHVLLNQHLGTSSDVPAPRIDHWVYDWVSRQQCYAWNYRKGAEILLASTAGITNLPTTLAFPALCGAITTIIVLVMGTVGLDCLQLGRKRTAALQFGFAFLFYLAALHLQGSLANLCSLLCFLVGAVLLRPALSKAAPFGIAALCGIVCGGGALYYGEVFVPMMGLPVVGVFVERLISQRKEGLVQVSTRFILVLMVSLVVSIGGLECVLPYFLHHATTIQRPSDKLTAPIVRELFLIPFANQAGIGSPFDDSPAEGLVSTSLTSQPMRLFIYAALLYLVAIVGYLRVGWRSLGLQLPFYLLVLITPVLYLGGDQFRLFRAVGYTVPYLFVGLVLSTTTNSGRLKWVSYIGIVVLFVFVSLNAFATVRTTLRIASHNLRTDSILHRLNPGASDWLTIRSELDKYSPAPVLVSGYSDTRTPHWIICGIEPHPNLVGKSITSNWPIHKSAEEWLLSNNDVCRYRGTVPLRELAKWNWDSDYKRLLDQSKQAIVPPAGSFPPEWKEWYDVLPAYRTRYKNICDIVYKDRRAILPDDSLGALKYDDRGAFRHLKSNWKPRLLDDTSVIYSMSILFDGEPSDLALRGFNSNLTLPRFTAESTQQTRVELALPSFDFGKLELVPRRDAIKLRAIELTRFPI